ncbi:YihY/virulence factor BrkB family protein [Agromyces seonyuensis]|uniref:YihY family inner membrane protein n=1 Tax=Agromyces seonyuensis TaxID=2662446 RepID=A0A6I4P4T2_9MICO|nr:YihY/virulence factor BrkB family protein [Agromyces seonyuensis]MWB98467.1 YihY family inner membrane protein [Agromyces seonyuensis]
MSEARGSAATHRHGRAVGPRWPWRLSGASWGYAFKRTLRGFTADGCTDLGAGLTYFAVLSIFPALLALTSLLGLFGQDQEATDALLDVVDEIAPGGTADLVRAPIEQFASAPAIGWALVIGLVLAVWSASAYVGAFGRAMNRIQGIQEGRPIWKLRPVQLATTLGMILVIVFVALALVISGPIAEVIGTYLGLGGTLQTVWEFLKWPVLLLALLLGIGLLYWASPNRKAAGFRWVLPGVLLAVIVLGIATLGFGFYVGNFANYDRTYGAFAGVIVFLLWVYIVNLALLLGAELNAEVERVRELESGMTAEDRLAAPVRDDAAIRKLALRELADVEAGRRLRLDAEAARRPVRAPEDERAAAAEEAGRRRGARSAAVLGAAALFAATAAAIGARFGGDRS